MKTQVATELFLEVTALAKKLIDAEAAKMARTRAQFARHSGGKTEDGEAEEESIKNAALLSAMMLLAGLAVNVARIADVLEADAMATDELIKTPRAREQL